MHNEVGAALSCESGDQHEGQWKILSITRALYDPRWFYCKSKKYHQWPSKNSWALVPGEGLRWSSLFIYLFCRIVGDDEGGELFTPEQYDEYKKNVLPMV